MSGAAPSFAAELQGRSCFTLRSRPPPPTPPPPLHYSTWYLQKKNLRNAQPVRQRTLVEKYDPEKSGSFPSTLETTISLRLISTDNPRRPSRGVRSVSFPFHSPCLRSALDLPCQKMCVESDGCEIEGCSSSDEVRTLSGSMSPGLKSNPNLNPCTPGQKFRAALLRCRTPAAAAGILSFGNVLNYMDRYTVAGKKPDFCFSIRDKADYLYVIERRREKTTQLSLFAGVILHALIACERL